MGSNAVNIGAGAASGMFFHAPQGTALPAYPGDTLAQAWKEVGFISQDGITWPHGRGGEPLKDWSNSIRRMLESKDNRTVAGKLISTTKEVLQTIFGAANVTDGAATSSHGALESVEVKSGVISGEEAFLFLMQDGDDAFMLGTTKGIVTNLDDVSFAPGATIDWGFTIAADAWTFMKDDGQKATQAEVTPPSGDSTPSSGESEETNP